MHLQVDNTCMDSVACLQKRLVPEAELAGPHSRFRTLEGIKVHYTVEQPPQGASSTGSSNSSSSSSIAAAHCYHGFGANTFSWSFVQVTPCHSSLPKL